MPSRPDAIQIVNFNNPSQAIYTIPIEIYRAPLMMVHGLWGNIEAFSSLESQLDANGYYSPLLTYIVDYSATNAALFYDNRNVIPSNINTLFSFLRSYGYSAGKVDIVAHSMGGLISRYYLQSNAYQQKQDIHKLITINTPHSGSPLANLLTNMTEPEADAARIAGELVASSFNSSIYFGAINDLAINSNSMNYLNFNTLNNGIVPSYSITTKCNIANDGVFYLIYLAATPFNMGVNAYLDYLFYDDFNDLVVSESSQSGGLPSFATSSFSDQFHIGSAANYSVKTEVINLINSSSSDENIFAQNGFAPVAIESHYKFAIDNNSHNYLSGNLIINNPIQNQYYNIGDLIPVNISSSNGITRIILEVVNRVTNSFVLDTILSNGTINYTVPADAFGKIKFLALGYDNNKMVDYDTVSININLSASLDSISSYLDTLLVQENNTAPTSITAYFDNNTSYLVSNLNNVQYQIADTNIAKPLYMNLIKGKQVGTTTLFVTYLGMTKVIPVVVFPQDSTMYNINFINSPNVENLSQIKIFPNPNNGNFSIQIETEIGEPITFEVFNQFGHKIFSQQENSFAKSFIKNISLDKFASGIYFVRVITKSKNYCGKIIFTR